MGFRGINSFGWRVFAVLLVCCTVLAFQNCGSTNPPESGKVDADSRGTLQANGGGYPGKLTVVAPTTIQEGTSYFVHILGALGSLSITSDQGSIEILSTDGSRYELQNNFSGIDEFQLTVQDESGQFATESILVIQGDDTFNYSYATRSEVINDKIIIFDSKIRLLLAFDLGGRFLKTLSPGGNRNYRFSDDLEVIASGDSSRIHVLDPQKRTIDVFSADLQFEKTIFLGESSLVKNPIGLNIINEEYVILEKLSDIILRFNMDGRFIGRLSLPEVPNAKYLSIAYDEISKTIWLANDFSKEIISVDKELSISRIKYVQLQGNNQMLFGPKKLRFMPEKGLLVLDRAFNGEDWQSPLSNYQGMQSIYLLTQLGGSEIVAHQLERKYVSTWHQPTDCLNISGSRVLYCNSKREVMSFDVTNNEIQSYSPRIQGDGKFKEPRNIVSLDDGSFWLNGQGQYMFFFNSSFDLMTKKGGWGSGPDQNYNIADFDIYEKYLVTIENKGHDLIFRDVFNYKLLLKVPLSQFSEFQNSEAVKISATKEHIHLLLKTGKILVFDYNGKKIEVKSQLNIARDIAVGPNGHTYLLSLDGFKVHVYTSENVLIKTIDLSKFAHGLVIGDDDFIFTFGDSHIVVFDIDQLRQLAVLNNPGVEAGAFNGIRGLTYRGGKMIVSERFNSRIQVLTLNIDLSL